MSIKKIVLILIFIYEKSHRKSDGFILNYFLFLIPNPKKLTKLVKANPNQEIQDTSSAPAFGNEALLDSFLLRLLLLVNVVKLEFLPTGAFTTLSVFSSFLAFENT